MSDTSREEWRRNWPLLLACTAGISVQGVAIYSLGQFLDQIEKGFGWSRSEASFGVSLSLVLAFLLAPLVGRVVDMTSARLLVIPGIILTGASLFAFSFVDGSLPVWFGIWAAAAIGGALVAPTVWVAVVTTAFTVRRSLAVGLALSGTGLSAGLVPPLTRYLIDALGWRAAYQCLGTVWCGIALILALFFFVDHRRGEAPLRRASSPARSQRPAELLLSTNFLKLAAAMFAVMSMISACTIHLSPVLIERGLDRTLAANLAGLTGIAMIAGKFGAGWLLDRQSLGAISSGAMLLLGIASALLAMPDSGRLAAHIACVALGLAGGAVLTLMACLSAKWFPPEHFGSVFGTLVGVVSLAGAVGPLVSSLVHDQFGNYGSLFWGGVFVALVAGATLVTLKPSVSDR